MTIGIEKLKERLEKAEAAKKKAQRQTQLLTTKLGKQERRDDTRRKVIDGAHMQTEALHNPELAALLHQMREANLVRDDDRALFGLALLSETEKAARGISLVSAKGGRRTKPKGENIEAVAPGGRPEIIPALKEMPQSQAA